MAELVVSLLVSPVVKKAIEKVVPLISQEFVSTFAVKKDLEKLASTLTAVKAVLQDGEEKQLTSHSLRDWLQKLEDAAYDAENILDAFSTEVHLRIRKRQTVRFQFPFKFENDISHKIKNISIRLSEIDQEKNQFQLIPRDPAVETQNPVPRTSFSENIKDVVGRDDDKNAIVQLLLSNELDKAGGTSVISITGMGGLGKTTLAQFICNDERIKDCFEFKMWVCVNGDFDSSRILNVSIEYPTVSKQDNFCLSLLEPRFEEILAKRKFLLVLDDVWNDDFSKWKSLKNILDKGGMGSKVLVTSRNSKVPDIMGVQMNYKLDFLSEEKCLELFHKIAFTQANNLSSETWLELEKIGREIILKCQYLPLAVEVMAGLLRGNVDVEKWRSILKDDIWEAEGNNPSIHPVLKLSYDHLSSTLRQCYAFCSIFPKGFIYDKKDLVKVWMAEGLIQSSPQKSGEQIGSEGFDELVMRFFFQPLDVDGKEKYKMQDLLHEFARLVARHYSCQVTDSDINAFDFLHASVLCRDVEPPIVEIIKHSKRLRTLLFPSEYLKDLKLQTLDKMFMSMTYIRVLDLSSSIILELPKSIKKLKLLRYLDLSKTDIQRLPDSLCELYNLQTLKLLGCLWLFELPKDLGELINLRHLELDDMFWYTIAMLPPGMGKLSHLQNLHAFHTGLEKGYGIEELKDMEYLTGTLRISKLENAANAREAKLEKKESLDNLVLEWSKRDGVHPEDQAAEERVLEELQPHTNLKSLKICNYRGTRAPVWMRDGLLQKLVTVSLKDCTNCRVLSLGELPHLQLLRIKGMQELENWPETVFPYLGMLKISDCPKLKKLPSFFPNLKVLNIKNCDTLEALTVAPLLKFLILVNNPVLADWKERTITFPKIQDQDIFNRHSYVLLVELKVVCCPKLPALPRFFAPQRLEISDCELLRALPVPELSARLQHVVLDACQDEKLLEAIPETSSLCSLVISNISNSTSLPKLPCLPGLEAFDIRACKDLVSLSRETAPLQHLSSLKLLSIQSCPELLSLPDGGLPATLECLMIGSCPKLEYLSPGDVLKRLNSLRDLYIEDCPKLKCLAKDGVSTSVQHLVIRGCPLLTEQCRAEEEGTEWAKIKDIPDLEIEVIHH